MRARYLRELEVSAWFEGVCVNYRNPGPRRGKPRVGSAPHVAFPVDPVDPVDRVDPAESSQGLKKRYKNNDKWTFGRENGSHF